MMAQHKRTTTEKGNVLFLILIAVALLAALSYAVTQSTRSGGSDASHEKARLTASNFLTLFAQIDSALTRLQISNSCKDEEIGLAPIVISNTGAVISDISIAGDGSTIDLSGYGISGPADQWAYNRRADGTCDIFGVNGGNVIMTIAQTSNNQLRMWDNFVFSLIEVVPIATQNLTSTNDIYMGFWADASAASEVDSARQVCEVINQLAATPFPSASGDSFSWLGSGTGNFWGKRTYCVFDPPGNVVLIHIIAER